jgi:hypothetical protein
MVNVSKLCSFKLTWKQKNIGFFLWHLISLGVVEVNHPIMLIVEDALYVYARTNTIIGHTSFVA